MNGDSLFVRGLQQNMAKYFGSSGAVIEGKCTAVKQAATDDPSTPMKTTSSPPFIKIHVSDSSGPDDSKYVTKNVIKSKSFISCNFGIGQ